MDVFVCYFFLLPKIFYLELGEGAVSDGESDSQGDDASDQACGVGVFVSEFLRRQFLTH